MWGLMMVRAEAMQGLFAYVDRLGIQAKDIAAHCGVSNTLLSFQRHGMRSMSLEQYVAMLRYIGERLEGQAHADETFEP